MKSETPELDKALFKAQGEFDPVIKKSENPHFKSKYADFASIKETIDPCLRENSLSVDQSLTSLTGPDTVHPALRTRLTHHASGEFDEDITPLVLLKQDPQALGSAITYLKRYAYLAILGLVPVGEDDDAEGGSGRGRSARQRPSGDQGGTEAGSGGSRGSQGHTGAGFSPLQQQIKDNDAYKALGAQKPAFLTDAVGYEVESLKQLSDEDCEAVLARLRSS